MENLIKEIGVAPFAERHFLKEAGGKMKSGMNVTIASFIEFINSELSRGEPGILERGSDMSFCKYLFVPNFTKLRISHMRIDNSNAQWLRTDYNSRTEEELEVLTREFVLPVPAPRAEYIMLILYNREQLLKEAEHSRVEVPDTDWSVISLMGLQHVEVPPMPPITIMRNALGIEEGGNAVKLDRAAYAASVDYWREHAMVR